MVSFKPILRKYTDFEELFLSREYLYMFNLGLHRVAKPLGLTTLDRTVSKDPCDRQFTIYE